jgi:hypothetical protein
MANERQPLSEVELALIKKHQGLYVKKPDKAKERERFRTKFINKHGKDEYSKLIYGGRYIKNRALVDQQLVLHPKADFSYAERKHMWVSAEDDQPFESTDL